MKKKSIAKNYSKLLFKLILSVALIFSIYASFINFELFKYILLGLIGGILFGIIISIKRIYSIAIILILISTYILFININKKVEQGNSVIPIEIHAKIIINMDTLDIKFPVNHTGYIVFADDKWVIKESILINNSFFQGRYQAEKKQVFDSLLTNSNWQFLKTDNRCTIYNKENVRATNLRKFPAFSKDTLIISDLNDGDFRVDSSRYIIEVPPKMLHQISPNSKSKEDLSFQKKERYTFSVNYKEKQDFELMFGHTPTNKLKIYIEMISPLFRNEVGGIIINSSFWSPFKWFVFFIFSIFSDQLRKKVFVPIITRILRKAGIRLFEEKK